MQNFDYKCPKCGNSQCDTGQMRGPIVGLTFHF